MTKLNFFLAFICIGAIILVSSCESNNHLRSEKKVKSQIQGTWRLAYPLLEEVWTFQDGVFYISDVVSGKIVPRDTGVYDIETTWKEPYVTISDVESFIIPPSTNLNGKWTIIELDNRLLYVAIRPNNAGMVQREFLKQ